MLQLSLGSSKLVSAEWGRRTWWNLSRWDNISLFVLRIPNYTEQWKRMEQPYDGLQALSSSWQPNSFKGLSIHWELGRIQKSVTKMHSHQTNVKYVSAILRQPLPSAVYHLRTFRGRVSNALDLQIIPLMPISHKKCFGKVAKDKKDPSMIVNLYERIQRDHDFRLLSPLQEIVRSFNGKQRFKHVKLSGIAGHDYNFLIRWFKDDYGILLRNSRSLKYQNLNFVMATKPHWETSFLPHKCQTKWRIFQTTSKNHFQNYIANMKQLYEINPWNRY